MTDQELERRLRDWYRSEIPAAEAAPIALRTRLAAIPRESPVRRRITSRRGVTLLAAAALVGLLGGATVVGGLLRPPAPPIPAVWTTTGRMINAHEAHTATLLPDGRVLVAGAGPTRDDPATAELYDASTGSWTATGKMTEGRYLFTATLLRDGNVLVAGGGEGDPGPARLATAELYDPETGTWAATGRMTQARGGHTATLLLDGRVLVAGGAYGAAELYDPGTGTWTATGNMVGDHFNNAATLLPDGTVLVAGESAEVYDPSAGTWTATGPMIHPHSDLGAAPLPVLPDGTVLVAGGAATSAELYDPRTRTWSATGSMIQARAQLAVTLLPDGTVLVTGGVGGADAVPSAELYDPSTGTWAATANMNAARRLHTATLLPGGTVLVVGGIGDVIDDDRASGSAELYHPGSMPSVVPPSQLPSAEPSSAPVAGRIVFTRWKTLKNGQEDCTTSAGFCHRASVFIANDDGSNERQFIPGPYSHVLAASPDGSKLIVSIREPGGDSVYVTDADGSTRRPLDTHCQSPCLRDFAFSFSADGSRLAFLRSRSGKPGPSGEDLVVATMDMASGTVVELESSHDFAGRPGLSPDGARVAFGNHVVDVDDSNLRQIASADLFTEESGVFSAGLAAPQWSPDGSLVAFTSFNETFPTNPPERNSQVRIDIFVVRPDGTGLQRLTTDTVGALGTNGPRDFGASFPTWTPDGRIVFTRYPAQEEDPFELWVMDADGSDATRLDPSPAAALTALGCVACPYPGTTYHDTGIPSLAFWIP
jgi:hypothetical protein